MSVLDQFRLDGKRAVVTGASRGLGRVMALALADVGADIVITGRTAETLDATAADIRARGRQAWTVVVDMAVPAECEGACKKILADSGLPIISAANMGEAAEKVVAAAKGK